MPLVFGWYELETKFGITSNPQPRTTVEASNQGWTTVGNNGCAIDGAAWPGTRWIPPRDPPDMVLIYDVDGNVAGMQSGMPASEFQGGVCPDSPYYQEDMLGSTKVSGYRSES